MASDRGARPDPWGGARRALLRRSVGVVMGLAVLLGLGLGTAADAQAVAVGSPTQLKIQYAGQTRSYIVYVPRSLGAVTSRPAVLLLHGNGGSGTGMMGQSRLNLSAEEKGFVAVYPETPGGRPWSDGRTQTAGYDDKGFLLKVVSDLVQFNGVDASRVFLGGNSSGGFMAQRMACDAAGSFGAVGVVSALLAEVVATSCASPGALPMIYFSGTADPIVPFDGAAWVRSQPATRDFWRTQGACKTTTGPVAQPDQFDDGTTVTLERVGQCARSGLRQDFYVITGGGHTWPGSRSSGPRSQGLISQEINATTVMVNFFATFGL